MLVKVARAKRRAYFHPDLAFGTTNVHACFMNLLSFLYFSYQGRLTARSSGAVKHGPSKK